MPEICVVVEGPEAAKQSSLPGVVQYVLNSATGHTLFFSPSLHPSSPPSLHIFFYIFCFSRCSVVLNECFVPQPRSGISTRFGFGAVRSPVLMRPLLWRRSFRASVLSVTRDLV